MLESLTLFSKGGLVLYQHVVSPSLLAKEEKSPASFTQNEINRLVSSWMSSGSSTTSNKCFHIQGRVTSCWKESSDIIAMALYPDIMFEGPP